MLISCREAAQILAAAGLTRDRTRWLLRAGFAGEGVRTRGSLLYDEAQVRALLEWPTVGSAGDPAGLDEVCRSGIFVARLTDTGSDLDLAVRQWQLSPYVRMEMRLAVETQGFLPFVATVCGFVASGANITAVWPGRSGSDEGSTLDLAQPGEWFDAFRNSRFLTGPGGSWLLWRTRGAGPWNSALQE